VLNGRIAEPYNSQDGINPSGNIINQGKMDFISANELNNLVGSNVDIVTIKTIHN
jgi:hypothetical protein